MSKGIIFEIKEFAVHDGPGIRKTVFFKGCSLRCNWCHNPEGLSFGKEKLIGAQTSRDCGKEYNAKELAKELLKGKEILEKSKGGITISGGEPLAQPEFLMELIDELKPINIALDTSGYASKEVFRKAIESVDLVLMDIKHTDSIAHKKMTGVDNVLILKNIDYLCRSGKKFYVRIPLIPGMNDTIENMQQTASILKNAKGLERVEFLPYNKAAGAKYSMLGKEYKPFFDVNKSVQVFLKPFQKYNIRSIVI